MTNKEKRMQISEEDNIKLFSTNKEPSYKGFKSDMAKMSKLEFHCNSLTVDEAVEKLFSSNKDLFLAVKQSGIELKMAKHTARLMAEVVCEVQEDAIDNCYWIPSFREYENWFKLWLSNPNPCDIVRMAVKTIIPLNIDKEDMEEYEKFILDAYNKHEDICVENCLSEANFKIATVDGSKINVHIKK